MTISCLAYPVARRVVLGAGALILVAASGGCSLIDGLQGGDSDIIVEPPGPDGGLPDGGLFCAEGQLLTGLSVDDAAGAMDVIFDGEVSVIENEPNTSRGQLVLDPNGELMVFNYDLGNGRLPLLAGERFHATIRTQGGLVPDVVLALNQVLGDGTLGALAAAMWDTSNDSFLVDIESKAGAPRYTATDCAPVNDGCGDGVSLDLEIRLPGEPPTLVEAGSEFFGGGYRAANSATSFTYVGPVRCPDAPERRLVGFISLP